MSLNTDRTKSVPSNYKKERGGFPVETGPYIGEVMNTHDPARAGRIQVYIEELGGNKDDKSTWRTVSYLSPFFGATQHTGSKVTTGKYVGNQQSYGMYFGVPDTGVKVLCIFANGDPNLGFYIGCIPDPDLMHMVPAIGSSENYQPDNAVQQRKFAGAARLPVTEINNENKQIREDPQSFNQIRPVHSVTAAELFQQGLLNDIVRGTVGSSSKRESPSNAYGIATPGRPIFESGLTEYNIVQSLAAGEGQAVSEEDYKIIGRRGGHTFVLDDGDIQGNDQHIRLRTSKGHQILLSDSGNCVHIIHANGQSWVEMGKEGTVDVYASNSINLRGGTINIHADDDVNMYAGRNVNIHGKENTLVEAQKNVTLTSFENTFVYGEKKVNVLSNGQMAITGRWTTTLSAAGAVFLQGLSVFLNSGSGGSAMPPAAITRTRLPDTVLTDNGFYSVEESLESIVTRAPTHEPYIHHNKGVATLTDYSQLGSGPVDTYPTDVQLRLDELTGLAGTDRIDLAAIAREPIASSGIGSMNVTEVSSAKAGVAEDIRKQMLDAGILKVDDDGNIS